MAGTQHRWARHGGLVYFLIALHLVTRGTLVSLLVLLLLATQQHWLALGGIQAMFAGNHILDGYPILATLVNAGLALFTAHPQAVLVSLVAYGTVELAQGIGLLRQERWGEYLTVLFSVSFVPFELRGLVQQGELRTAILLLINLAVIAYLVRTRRLWPVSILIRPENTPVRATPSTSQGT